jgi:hypothetical protein
VGSTMSYYLTTIQFLYIAEGYLRKEAKKNK